MDKLVIDIETSNTFQDVGGHRNLKDLKVSLVGVYSYEKDEYLSFGENELDKVGPLMQAAGLIIGFAINRFDIPVLDKHCDYNALALPRLDLLEEIELQTGIRVGLNVLAKANLGAAKTGHGLQAVTLYNEGKFDELRDYCLMDVKLTKDLYEFIKKQGHIIIPDRITDEPRKYEMNIAEAELPAKLF